MANSDEVKLTANQLNALNEEMQTVIIKTLPTKDFILLKQDDVIEVLGEQDYYEVLMETESMNFVEQLEVNFGTRCEISIINTQLYLRCELYGTPKGERQAGTIDLFYEPVKDFADMQAKIKQKVPAMFEKINEAKP
jgi:hypothetical protein